MVIEKHSLINLKSPEFNSKFSPINHKCCAQPFQLSTAFSFLMIILLRIADSTFSIEPKGDFQLGDADKKLDKSVMKNSNYLTIFLRCS